jgi:hypothetical protein
MGHAPQDRLTHLVFRLHGRLGLRDDLPGAVSWYNHNTVAVGQSSAAFRCEGTRITTERL